MRVVETVGLDCRVIVVERGVDGAAEGRLR